MPKCEGSGTFLATEISDISYGDCRYSVCIKQAAGTPSPSYQGLGALPHSLVGASGLGAGCASCTRLHGATFFSLSTIRGHRPWMMYGSREASGQITNENFGSRLSIMICKPC